MTFPKIEVKFTKAKQFDTNRLLKNIKRAVKREAERVKIQFEYTCETWNEHHPEFTIEASGGWDDIVYTIGTENEIYYYLNYGTKVRRAFMEEGFESKTRPGQLRPKTGQGKMAFVDPNATFKGIEARRWDELISEKHDSRNLSRDIEDAFDDM